MVAVPLLPRFDSLVADVIESVVDPGTEIGYMVWTEMAQVECSGCPGCEEGTDCQAPERLPVIYFLLTLDCCAEHRITQATALSLGLAIEVEQVAVDQITTMISNISFRQIQNHSLAEEEVTGGGEG